MENKNKEANPVFSYKTIGDYEKKIMRGLLKTDELNNNINFIKKYPFRSLDEAIKISMTDPSFMWLIFILEFLLNCKEHMDTLKENIYSDNGYCLDIVKLMKYFTISKDNEEISNPVISNSIRHNIYDEVKYIYKKSIYNAENYSNLSILDILLDIKENNLTHSVSGYKDNYYDKVINTVILLHIICLEPKKSIALLKVNEYLKHTDLFIKDFDILIEHNSEFRVKKCLSDLHSRYLEKLDIKNVRIELSHLMPYIFQYTDILEIIPFKITTSVIFSKDDEGFLDMIKLDIIKDLNVINTIQQVGNCVVNYDYF